MGVSVSVSVSVSVGVGVSVTMGRWRAGVLFLCGSIGCGK